MEISTNFFPRKINSAHGNGGKKCPFDEDLIVAASKESFFLLHSQLRQKKGTKWLGLSVCPNSTFRKERKRPEKNSDVCPFPRWAYVQ